MKRYIVTWNSLSDMLMGVYRGPNNELAKAQCLLQLVVSSICSLLFNSPITQCPLVSSAGLQSAKCLGIPSTSTCVAEHTAVTKSMGQPHHTFWVSLVSQTLNLQRGAYFSEQSPLWQGSRSACLDCASHIRAIPLKGARLYQKTMSRGLFLLHAACRLMVLWYRSIIPFPAGLKAQQKTHRTFHFSHTCTSCYEQNVELLSSNNSSGGPPTFFKNGRNSGGFFRQDSTPNCETA